MRAQHKRLLTVFAGLSVMVCARMAYVGGAQAVSFSDGFGTWHEYVAKVTNENGDIIPNVTVRFVSHSDLLGTDRFLPQPRSWYEDDGRLRFGGNFGGVGSETYRCLGGVLDYARYDGSAGSGIHFRVLWGHLEFDGPKRFPELILSCDGREVARIREDELLRLPVADYIPPSRSALARIPNAITSSTAVPVSIWNVRLGRLL